MYHQHIPVRLRPYLFFAFQSKREHNAEFTYSENFVMLGENERGKTHEAFILMAWLVKNPHENTHTHERYP